MQGLMVVGLIVEEIVNIDVKCVKYRSRSPGQLRYLQSQYM